MVLSLPLVFSLPYRFSLVDSDEWRSAVIALCSRGPLWHAVTKFLHDKQSLCVVQLKGM